MCKSIMPSPMPWRMMFKFPVVGFDEEDLSSLEGLSDDDLSALEELKDLKPEEIKALAEANKPDEKDESIARLQATLKKERDARRTAERQRKDLETRLAKLESGAKPSAKPGEKPAEGSGEKSDEELEAERAKSGRLAVQFATNAVDTTILRVLGGKGMPKFADPDDVIRLIKRDDIDVEQDLDDPSKVTVDDDTVKAAIKALAKLKKHLLVPETPAGEGEEGTNGQGSKFGGQRNAGTAKSQDEALLAKYPALRRQR